MQVGHSEFFPLIFLPFWMLKLRMFAAANQSVNEVLADTLSQLIEQHKAWGKNVSGWMLLRTSFLSFHHSRSGTPMP